MRRSRGRILLLAAVLSGCGADPGAGWRTFAPAGQGFRVSLPGRPQTRRDGVPLGNQSARTAVHMLSRRDHTVYLIQTTDFPAGMVVLGQPLEQALDVARDARLKQYGAELVGARTFEIEGHRGREYEMRVVRAGAAAPKGSLLRARDLPVGDRVYQWFVLMRPEHDRREDARRFLDSFQLVEAKKVTKPLAPER